jgi:hypothetical protein
MASHHPANVFITNNTHGTAGGDEVFAQLVLARIIEPVSKADSARVLEEAGLPPVPYRTVTRRLRVFAQDSSRQQISAACAAHAGVGPGEPGAV